VKAACEIEMSVPALFADPPSAKYWKFRSLGSRVAVACSATSAQAVVACVVAS
jgi:hypothetical protein